MPLGISCSVGLSGVVSPQRTDWAAGCTEHEPGLPALTPQPQPRHPFFMSLHWKHLQNITLNIHASSGGAIGVHYFVPLWGFSGNSFSKANNGDDKRRKRTGWQYLCLFGRTIFAIKKKRRGGWEWRDFYWCGLMSVFTALSGKERQCEIKERKNVARWIIKKYKVNENVKATTASQMGKGMVNTFQSILFLSKARSFQLEPDDMIKELITMLFLILIDPDYCFSSNFYSNWKQIKVADSCIYTRQTLFQQSLK